MALPQPKTGEISDLIEAESRKPRSDEFSLKRIEREIAVLRKSSDSAIRNEALSLSGALAALRFDLPAARQNFEQALAASGYSANVYFNYASVLLSSGLVEDATVMAQKAAEKVPDDPLVLKLAVRAAGTAFDLQKVEFFAQRLAVLQVPNDDVFVRETLEGVSWQKVVLDSPGVTRPALVKRYERARKIAFDHCVRVPHERATSSTRGTLIEWATICDDEETTQMNFETAVALSEFDPDPCEAVVSFGYRLVATFASEEPEKIWA